jgi:putative ABC transport system permease protein
LLSLAAGGLGVLGAWWGVLILRGLHLADIPRFDSARIDLRVLLFAACVSTVTGILSGLIPAWKAARPNLLASLQLGGMSTYPRGQGQLCNLLGTIEVAVAIVLLAGAGLLINSFVHLTRADWGFNPDHLLLVPTNLPRSLDKDFAARIQFNEDVVNRLARVPGVASSAMAYGVPIKYFWSLTQLAIGGRWVNRDWEAATWIVGPEYFRTMQIPLLRGREFNVRDDELAQRAVVVSKKLADQLWPGTDPIRKQFGVLKLKKDLETLVRKDPESSLIPKIIGSPESWEPDGTPWQVVGEVGNVRAFGLDSESQAALYIDYQQRTLSWASEIFVVRTSSAPLKLAPAIKRQIMGAEKRITFGNISSMSDLVSESIGGRGSNKLLLVVSSLFGSLSLLIASVGIYGVVAFSVAQRTREIGIRRTLGAKRGEILRMVIVQSLRPVFFGLLLGLANSFVVTRLLKGLLFGVTPTDPFTFLSISVLLVVAACAACMSPPLRALRVDPSECLRYE